MKTNLEKAIDSHRTHSSPENHARFIAGIEQARARCNAACEMPKCGLISGVFKITLRTIAFKDGSKRICQHCLRAIAAKMKEKQNGDNQ